MAKIKAFIGYRPPNSEAKAVAAPPYDVLDSAEAREMASGNEKSFLHINKPEIDLDPAIDLHDDSVYATARANLDAFIEKGWLVPDSKPCLYAYRQTMGEHAQMGLVACAAVDDYDEDFIKKHEKTRRDKEDDRARHVDETNCNAGPVFLTYRAQKAMDELMTEASRSVPDVDFTAGDGIGHTLWVIDDDDLQKRIVETFGTINPTYVADGHHRAKSGSRVRDLRRKTNPNHDGSEEYNWFLTVFFPHDQLKILDYNRVAKDLNGLSEAEFLSRVEERFEIRETDTPRPENMHDFGLYLNGKWRRLTARPGSFDPADPVGGLDVSILQNNLLTPILGIEDPRTDRRIDFVGGIRGMAELEKRVNGGAWALAFALYPTTLDQLMAIADAGEIMPPKSTWFEPKLRSGLVVHLLS